MKQIKILFLLLFVWISDFKVYGEEIVQKETNPCFIGDYRDELYKENEIISTSEGNFTYTEYYTYYDYVPYFADAVLLIDGNYVPDVFPIIENDTSFVPIRVVVDNLGGHVEWEEVDKKVTITENNIMIELFINNSTANVNGVETKLSEPPKIVDGVTYVPLRFVAENLNLDVNFQKGKKYSFPNIITIKSSKVLTETPIVSSEQALEMAKRIFIDADWGDFLKEQYGDAYDLLEFSVQEEPMDRFWVIDINLNGEPTVVSIWVNQYTGQIYSKYGGYEGVFGVSEGGEKAISSIKYHLF